jgi:hypothetical protein
MPRTAGYAPIQDEKIVLFDSPHIVNAGTLACQQIIFQKNLIHAET